MFATGHDCGPLYLAVNDNPGFEADNLAGFTVLFTGEQLAGRIRSR